jgi:hypothetical protein
MSSSEHSIIPRDITGYNTFIITTTPYLTTGNPQKYVQFGFSASQLATWQSYETQWNALYPSYLNKKGGRTTDVKNDLLNIIDAHVAYDKTNKLIMKIKATNGLTSTDCSTFNIPQSFSAPVTSTHAVIKSKIPEKIVVTVQAVYPKMIPAVGGFIDIKAFTEKAQSGRAHKLKGFDLIEYAVAVFYSTATGLPLTAADPRLTIDHSSKAHFVLSTVTMTSNLTAIPNGQGTPTKVAVLFFRWAKSKHPTLDGPWNGPFSTPLL